MDWNLKMWGKVIFASRFCLKIMEEGMVISFGILLPELTEYLESSSAVTGLLISLYISTWYLGAPLSQLLLDHCNRPRLLTTLCGLVAGITFMGTAFTDNVVLFGFLLLLSALCSSVLNRQAALLLHQHFPDNFTFISILTFFGTILGGTLFPQMVFLSLMAYGVRGSLLILGGLLMHLLPIGYALKVSTKQEEITDDDNNDESLPLISRPKETVENINASGSNGNATNALGEIRAPKVDSSKKSPDKEGYFLNSSQRHTPSGHLERKNSDRLREAENQPSQLCCDDTDETRKETKDGNGRIWKMLSRLKEVMHMDFFNEHPLLSCTLIPSVGIFNCVILGWDLFEVTYGISRGIDRRTVKFIPIASFAGCAFSHILLIFIFQRKPQYNILVFFSSCCLATLGFFLMNLSSSLWYILMVSFVMGVGTNGVINTSEGVIAFVVENRSFAHGSSLIDLFTGLGLITAGLVAGYIKDVSGSMVTLYWSLGGMNLVASLLTLVMVCKVSRALACCQQ